MREHFDFEGLAKALLPHAVELCPRWLPGGRLIGREYTCGNLRGEPGDSCKVNVDTGQWADFATDDRGGDLISLYAAIEGLDQLAAAKKLAAGVGFTVWSDEPTKLPASGTGPTLVPPPPDISSPNMVHAQYGAPSITWCYRNEQGAALFHVARYDTPDGKRFVPWSWDGHRWVARAWPAPRPLYGLDRLAAHPDRPVILLEGERCADAAQTLAGAAYVAVTWPAGAKAVAKANWAPLHNRKVLLWPDADEPGVAAMQAIANLLIPHCPEIKVLDPTGQPPGWDLADAVADGWDWAHVVAWAKPRARILGNADTPPPIGPATTVIRTDEDVSVVSARNSLDTHLTDLGNARRLVAQHGADLRYCHPWKKWLVWDGRRWLEDDTGEADRRAKETIIAMYSQAGAVEEFRDRQDLAKHALRSEAAPKLTAMLTLAKSEPGIPVLPDHLDANPWLLNVENGTLNLQTGDLRPARREDFITKLAPVVYDPTAPCPLWDRFLARIFAGNAELMGFLQRAAGYALTGQTSEQVLFFLYGTGANGKSTFVETIRACLGEYAQQMPTDTLMCKQGDRIPNDIARLKSARFVAATETEEGRRLSEVQIKQLTGGDTITARFMRAEFFEFSPTHKLFVATNHKPLIRGTDHAIWRRIRVLPFTVTIPPTERDPGLLEHLKDELSGILAWAVRGCADWQAHGLGFPRAVQAATEGYRQDMDVLAGFLRDRCALLPDARVQAKDLYAAYKTWCEASGEYCISLTLFGIQLAERGFEKRKSDGRYWYLGLGLQADGVAE